MPFTGVSVRPFTVDYQNKGFENAQYNITSAMTFMTPGGATPRVDFGGKQVAARYVYWTADNGAHPLQTNGDLSSLPHLCSTNAGQCGLHWRQNLHCLFPS